MEYRGYLIKPLGTFAMYSIHSKGSGSLPKSLKGRFTNYREVTLAIDGHLESLKKGNRNGSSKGSGTS